MSNNPRRLLIVGAGAEQIPAYELALKMGLKVVGSDMNPNAPAFSLPVDKIVASTYDPLETVTKVKEYAQEHTVDGVMTLACDAPLTVARVAQELGLPGLTEHSAMLGTDKLEQIKKFNNDGLPVPEFEVVESYEVAETIARKWGYPLIIKPIVGRGGRGVLRITSRANLETAFADFFHLYSDGRILMQKYLDGPQISSESIIVDSVAYTALYSGRNYEHLETFAPYIIENGGWLPALISDDQKLELDRVVQLVADSYGITNGFIKGDLVLTDYGVKIVEFAARMGGGYAVSHSIPACHQINLVEQAIKMALGMEINLDDLVPRYRQSSAVRFFLPEPGLVKAINGFENLTELDWVIVKKMYIEVGEILEPITDHTKRAGVVIVTGKDHQEAEKRVTEAIKMVEIVTEPV